MILVTVDAVHRLINNYQRCRSFWFSLCAAQQQQLVHDLKVLAKQQHAEKALLVDAEKGLTRKDSSDSSESIDVQSAFDSTFEDDDKVDSWRASLDLARQMQNFSSELEKDQMQRSSRSSVSFGSKNNFATEAPVGSTDIDPMQRSQRSSSARVIIVSTAVTIDR